MGSESTTCRFVSSLGGVHRCLDLPYREGFCRFHFDAFVNGEILLNAQISEHLTDQHRRRALNYHGLPPPEDSDPASQR